MRILEQCFRVYSNIAEFNDTVAFYEELQGVACARRLTIAETGVMVAKVGGFLVLAGREDQIAKVRHVDAIFYVDSLDSCASWLKANGAETLHPPRKVTSGANLTARHADGLVVEYFEAATDL